MLKLEWDLTAGFRADLGDKADEFILSQAREYAQHQGLPDAGMRVTWREWTAAAVLNHMIRVGGTSRHPGDWHATVRLATGGAS